MGEPREAGAGSVFMAPGYPGALLGVGHSEVGGAGAWYTGAGALLAMVVGAYVGAGGIYEEPAAVSDSGCCGWSKLPPSATPKMAIVRMVTMENDIRALKLEGTTRLVRLALVCVMPGTDPAKLVGTGNHRDARMVTHASDG